MGIKISELQSFVGSVQDTDLLEISVDNGLGGFNSRKITGAQFKSLINSLTIYEADGTITGNRALDGDSYAYALSLNNLSAFTTDAKIADFVLAPPSTLTQSKAFNVEVDPTYLSGVKPRLFQVKDSVANVVRFGVLDDGSLLINAVYTLPNADGGAGQVLTTDGAGNVSFQPTISADSVNFGSTQWSATIVGSVPLTDGSVANGFEFFDDATDKSASGTTTYDEYSIAYTRKLTLTGTSGSANVNIDGTDYLASFSSDLTTTASNFVTTHEADILSNHGIRITSVGELIKFADEDDTLLSAMTITNVSGDLSGTFNTAVGDHVLIPYTGTAYEGQRLQHNFRVNFGIDNSTQNRACALSLRRWMDDSIIGSTIKVFRDQVETGNQFNFISYTAGSTDPFVTGGFYFALENNTGGTINFQDNIGILIQTYYQKPIKF